jgi:hypothetical protein
VEKRTEGIMDIIEIDRFENEGRVHVLDEPIPFELTFADGLWLFHNATLNLWGYGPTRTEAIADLNSAFDDLWREIVEEADESLNTAAIEIKKILLNHLKIGAI